MQTFAIPQAFPLRVFALDAPHQGYATAVPALQVSSLPVFAPLDLRKVSAKLTDEVKSLPSHPRKPPSATPSCLPLQVKGKRSAAWRGGHLPWASTARAYPAASDAGRNREGDRVAVEGLLCLIYAELLAPLLHLLASLA